MKPRIRPWRGIHENRRDLHQAEGAGTQRADPFASVELLVLLLALFGSLGTAARGVSFGFLFSRVTLGVGLILLRLALFGQVVTAGQRSANLFGLALDALDGTLDSFFCAALVIAHSSILPLGVVELALCVVHDSDRSAHVCTGTIRGQGGVAGVCREIRKTNRRADRLVRNHRLPAARLAKTRSAQGARLRLVSRTVVRSITVVSRCSETTAAGRNMSKRARLSSQFVGIALLLGCLREAGGATTTIAVIGASGTAGRLVTARLKGRDVAVVEISRAHGIDLVSGHGLAEALEGVDVGIDVANPMPANGNADITATLVTAYHNVVGACAAQGIKRLVVSTIAGIEDPAFDGFPYFVAKRATEQIVLKGPIPATIVMSTQWYEFATNPAVVNFNNGEVRAQDWLTQPIAAGTVADVLVEAALGQARIPRTVTGPDAIGLPGLVSKRLALLGDGRPKRATKPPLTAFSTGALLAPDHATVLGPEVGTWLETLAPDHAYGNASAVAGTEDLSRSITSDLAST